MAVRQGHDAPCARVRVSSFGSQRGLIFRQFTEYSTAADACVGALAMGKRSFLASPISSHARRVEPLSLPSRLGSRAT